MSRLIDRILVGLVCIAIAWFYVWTARSNGESWKFGQEQRDYYNLLIDGWLDRHLHMKVDVPPALLALPDPYDPTLRPPGLALHDASFYRGRYYLYFGAAPVVTLMLPFRLLTGTDLPLPMAILVFVYGGFLAAGATFLAIRRRYFLETGRVVVLWGGLALGLAALGPVLLRRTQMWELPIAAAYGFAMLALFGVFRSLHSNRHRAAWLAAAGAALGLAIASRPTHLVAIPMLFVPLIWSWRHGRSVPWREGVAAGWPLALVGALMAWHNFARFGDPLQFGQAYQFSLDYESKVQHFSGRYVPFNGWRYFFSPAQWRPYFPFIRPAELPPKPAGFGGHDDVYGVLVNLPLAWFALAAPLSLWHRPRQERARLGTWLAATTLLFAALTTLLLFFFGSLARYLLEFTPALILLGCVGLLSVARLVPSWKNDYARALARVAATAAALFSVCFGVLYSLQLNRLMAELNPAGEREVARGLNHVPAWIERIAGVEPGAWELDVKLPVSPAARSETLLTIGEPPGVDRVFVRYRDDQTVQVGFMRVGMPEVVSSPRMLGHGKTHRLRVTLGAFLPPAEHPWFEGTPPDGARRASRILRLELNGETLVETYRRFEANAGGRVRVGGRSLGEPAYPRFSGEVAAVRRITLHPAELGRVPAGSGLSGAGDTFRMKLKFPAHRPGATEPLVVTGATGKGDLLGVEYLDPKRVRFIFDHWGSRLLASEPRTIDFAAEHELSVQFSWLQPVRAARAEIRGDLRVWMGGALVWEQTTMGYRADPEEIAVGANPIGGSNCGPVFSGAIRTIERADKSP